jgi:hypothetical protein
LSCGENIKNKVIVSGSGVGEEKKEERGREGERGMDE